MVDDKTLERSEDKLAEMNKCITPTEAAPRKWWGCCSTTGTQAGKSGSHGLYRGQKGCLQEHLFAEKAPKKRAYFQHGSSEIGGITWARRPRGARALTLEHEQLHLCVLIPQLWQALSHRRHCLYELLFPNSLNKVTLFSKVYVIHDLHLVLAFKFSRKT